MAGKTDLSGNYFCTTTDGFVFEIFTDGKRNLVGVYMCIRDSQQCGKYKMQMCIGIPQQD